VRDAQVAYIPAIVTIGPREEESGAVSVRTLDGTVSTLSIDAFIDRCAELARTFSKETSF
jgi:threonyl-tRNA synthetase